MGQLICYIGFLSFPSSLVAHSSPRAKAITQLAAPDSTHLGCQQILEGGNRIVERLTAKILQIMMQARDPAKILI